MQNTHIKFFKLFSFSEISRQNREEWQCLRSRPGNDINCFILIVICFLI